MRILIVEDDPSSRLYLESLLEINKFDYRSAENGVEGLNIFDEYNPDIIITDIQMPIMNGIELLEAVKLKKRSVIVIITTAFGSEKYAIQALERGANNYLKKPVTNIDLLPLLNKYEIILKSRYATEELQGKLINRTFELEFNTSINNIPAIVDRVLIESNCNFDESVRTNIELGLVELITNAIEHGNLEISYKEKLQALKNNKLEALYESRLSDFNLKNRKIRVNFKSGNNAYEWIITDEGKGFDWKSLPNPTEQNNILELSGRGVFISRFLFDELEYRANGNVVRALKYKDNKIIE